SRFLSVGEPRIEAPEGFEWTPLSSVARLESGHTPARKHPEYWDGDIPWIGIRDATANHGRTIYSTRERVTQAGVDNSSTRLLPANTVCLSRTASVGYVVTMGVPMCTSQDFVNWFCGPDLNHRYLSYVLRAEHDSMLRFAHGTTHQTIYFPEVKAFHVCLPDRRTQDGVAETLGALDDKIESNRRVVKTSWDLALAAWRQIAVAGSAKAPLDELVSLNPEEIRPGLPEEVISYVDIASVSARSIDALQELSWADAPSRARRCVADGDVIFSTVRPNRRSFALVLEPTPSTVVSTGFAVLRPTERLGPSALAAIVDAAEFADYLGSIAEGSAYPAVSASDIGDYSVRLPAVPLLAEFERSTMPIRLRAARSAAESISLAALRDALLPELLSGRLRVPEAEELVSDVV
ncbi:MAG: restriction endonuclease subunit S, partial [Acidimicrobiales bacterium]|nr:restriction endonuclease subunit S [Acidimicrobiales bacterium]